jgi:hypothetical protein
VNRPRPVLTGDAIGGAVHAVALVAAFLGYANVATSIDGEAQGIVSAALVVATLVAHFLPGLFAQQAVTPLSDPRDAAGNQLVSTPPAVMLQAANPLRELVPRSIRQEPEGTVVTLAEVFNRDGIHPDITVVDGATGNVVTGL